MAQKPRPRPRHSVGSRKRCESTHNPGEWPYAARCVRMEGHLGKGLLHRDNKGREWDDEGRISGGVHMGTETPDDSREQPTVEESVQEAGGTEVLDVQSEGSGDGLARDDAEAAEAADEAVGMTDNEILADLEYQTPQDTYDGVPDRIVPEDHRHDASWPELYKAILELHDSLTGLSSDQAIKIEYIKELADKLQTEKHVVEFREDGYAIKHPLSCRPNLFGCTADEWVREATTPDENGDRVINVKPGYVGRHYIERDEYGAVTLTSTL